jgi:hypothetical protein
MRRPDDSAPIPMSPPSQPKVKWDRTEARPFVRRPMSTQIPGSRGGTRDDAQASGAVFGCEYATLEDFRAKDALG